jgi:hypothetical protein
MVSDIKNAWVMENITAMNWSKTKVMKFRQGEELARLWSS